MSTEGNNDNGRDLKKIKVILQKLWAQANDPSCTPQERMTFNEHAAKLMLKYGIEEMSAQTSEEVYNGMTRYDVRGLRDGGRRDLWEQWLAGEVAEAFDSDTVNTKKREEVGPRQFTRSWYIAFIGMKKDVELSIWYFKYLRFIIEKLGDQYYANRINSGKDFKLGMVEVIAERLQEMKKIRDREAQKNVRSRDLVVVKDTEVQRYKKAHFPWLKKGPALKLGNDPHAYRHGRREGERVSLSRPIENQGKGPQQIRR